MVLVWHPVHCLLGLIPWFPHLYEPLLAAGAMVCSSSLMQVQVLGPAEVLVDTLVLVNEMACVVLIP